MQRAHGESAKLWTLGKCLSNRRRPRIPAVR